MKRQKNFLIQGNILVHRLFKVTFHRLRTEIFQLSVFYIAYMTVRRSHLYPFLICFQNCNAVPSSALCQNRALHILFRPDLHRSAHIGHRDVFKGILNKHTFRIGPVEGLDSDFRVI